MIVYSNKHCLGQGNIFCVSLASSEYTLSGAMLKIFNNCLAWALTNHYGPTGMYRPNIGMQLPQNFPKAEGSSGTLLTPLPVCSFPASWGGPAIATLSHSSCSFRESGVLCCGENLCLFAHVQHQSHLESPLSQLSTGTSKDKLPLADCVRTKGGGCFQTTAISLTLHGCQLKRKCLLLLSKTMTTIESLQPSGF